MLSSLSPAPQKAVSDDVVKDVNLDQFMAEVIDASRTNLIVVDFWATWCGPCKQLTPILEKLVRAYNGAVTLAKIDIDQNPEIAQQMGVQSVPAVFAFFGGRPIDGFMGALPESQIRTWLERLIKAAGIEIPAGPVDYTEALKYAADFLDAKDVPAAQEIYANILEDDATHAGAYAGMLRCLMAIGNLTTTRDMLTKAPESIAKDTAIQSVKAALELAEQAAQQPTSGSTADLLAKIAADPADYQARYDLAMTYYAAEQKQEAVDALLEIIRLNRQWNEDGARKQLVKFFEAFGVMDPITVAARKRLSSMLFS